MTTAADVPLLIKSENSTSERRVSPAWTVSQFKARLEPITGVPAGCQRLLLQVSSRPPQFIQAVDEDSTQIASWSLQAYAEIEVQDTRPPGLRINYNDVSSVQKYEMSMEDYEARNDSVLAWKKKQQLGRFDPAAPSIEQAKIAASFREASERNIAVGSRCRLLPDNDHRRGTVRYLGEIPEIPGVGAWVGIELDEPTGKNDGSIKDGPRYFDCKNNFGVFVKPERVEVGDFSVLDEFADDDDEF